MPMRHDKDADFNQAQVRLRILISASVVLCIYMTLVFVGWRLIITILDILDLIISRSGFLVKGLKWASL